MTGSATTARPGLIQIGDVFARYANFTLGGGSATVAVLHRELLDKRRWVNDDSFTLSFALARLTPGTNLLAFCTGVGWLLRGLPGAIVALLGRLDPVHAHRRVGDRAVQPLAGQPVAASGHSRGDRRGRRHHRQNLLDHRASLFQGAARLRVFLVFAAAFLLHIERGIPAIQVLLLAAAIGALLPPVRQ